MEKMKWDEIFELAKTYYNYYGNLEVPKNFKTINGYEYNENGINLHNWIYNQGARISTKKSKFFCDENLNSVKFKSLNNEELLNLLSIGIWPNGFAASLIKNKIFFQKYNISDHEIIKKLRKRSFIELLAIEDYLINYGLPVITENTFNDIFFMNGLQIKDVLGIQKSELLYNYISKNYNYFSKHIK